MPSCVDRLLEHLVWCRVGDPPHGTGRILSRIEPTQTRYGALDVPATGLRVALSMNDSRLPSRLTNPASWLALFGPGAIVASLTIGSGELLFSSRGGALFGYRLLGLFLVICLLKWALVLTTSRQMILTGAHPFQRWMSCPGPRGWLPIVFLISAVALFPVWVGFHAATVGTLLASLTGTKAALRESSHFVWGLGTLGATMLLVWSGSYKRLERIQMFVVFVMLGCVLVSLDRFSTTSVVERVVRPSSGFVTLPGTPSDRLSAVPNVC